MILLLIVGVICGLLISFGYRLMPLVFSRRNVNLRFTPNDLRTGEVVIAILAMMVKSMLPVSLCAWLAPATLTLTSPFVMTEEHLARYQLAIGKRSEEIKEVNPLHQLLFFSAVTEPAMLLLLASPACPVSPLGAVNVRNRFEFIRPDLGVPTAFKNFGQAYLTAKIHNVPRPVKRGVEYDLEVALNIKDQTNIGGSYLVFRQVFTMLEFRKNNNARADSSDAKDTPWIEPSTQPESTIPLSFEENDPLRWARLCKDYNFIHLSHAIAKAFGLPGKLIHGNHAIARALQVVPTRSPGNAPAWIEVQFRKPMVVPGLFEVAATGGNEECDEFSIFRAGKVHAATRYGVLNRKRWGY